MSTATMSPADVAAHEAAQGPVRRCTARTARGMRTPTGDYLTCSGEHAPGEPHGASFGTAGWFTWTEAPRPSRRVLASFPAGAPRGQWPAEAFAAEQRREGVPARVVMDLASDSFLVIVEGGERRG